MVALITLAVLVVPLVYIFLRHKFTYWQRRGIPQLNPSFLSGDFGQFFRMKECFGRVYEALYETSKKLPFVGVYISFRPALLINDPELIKSVLVRDFDHFHDRGMHVDESTDPLSGHLFALGGNAWRHHRSKLSPTFTSGRLKGMFPNIMKIGRVLQDHIERRAAEGRPIEIREVMARYTTDVIASVGFGVEIDSINDDANVFRRMGSKVFSSDVKTIIRLASTFFLPKFKAALGFKFIEQEVEDFMMGLVRETLEYRESNNVVRKDMMQLLLQLRNSGTVSIDERWDVDSTTKQKQLSLEQVAAHAFVFFLAGFETSSTTISFCLYELAKHAEIRRKVQHEIDEVLSRYNGEVTYENITEMKYLEQCVNETLRKYPPLPFLNRECTKEYTIPGSAGVVIEKGTSIVVPVMGLHRDPNYFPEPERFIPERFSDGQQISEKAYMPFGIGPRFCVGMRLGNIQTLLGLVMILSKFDIQLVDEKQKNSELAFSALNIVLFPTTGISLTVIKRK